MTGLLCLTLYADLATLVALGVKTVETRTGPPAGDMRPPGVRPIPGFRLNRGDRVGIHAGMAVSPAAALAAPGTRTGTVGTYTVERDNPRGRPAAYILRGPSMAWPYRLPLGALVATAVVVDAVPIEDLDAPTDEVSSLDAPAVVYVRPQEDPEQYLLYVHRHQVPTVDAEMGDQLPYGIWTPGRWALLLDDVAPTIRRCPWCWGSGWEEAWTNRTDYGTGSEDDGIVCPVCSPGDGDAGAGTCPPIPATGRLGVWRWEP